MKNKIKILVRLFTAVGIVLIAISCHKGLLPPRMTKEQETRVHLGALRSALALYQVDHHMQCPDSLLALSLGELKYIDIIPEERISKSTNTVTAFDGTGGWYLNLNECQVHPNLGGNDSEGKAYSSW